MKTLTLNLHEYNYYTNVFMKRVNELNKGTHFYSSDIFYVHNEVPSARLCRFFYENVIAGAYPKIRLSGTRSRHGYIII